MAIVKTIGGGGSFFAEFLSGTIQINAGATGNVTISCPTNKRLRLTLFSAIASFQDDVSLSVGSKSLFGPARLDDGSNSAQAASRFSVGHAGGNAASGVRHYYVDGNFNEDIVFNFGSVTTQNVVYAYEVGS